MMTEAELKAWAESWTVGEPDRSRPPLELAAAVLALFAERDEWKVKAQAAGELYQAIVGRYERAAEAHRAAEAKLAEVTEQANAGARNQAANWHEIKALMARVEALEKALENLSDDCSEWKDAGKEGP